MTNTATAGEREIFMDNPIALIILFFILMAIMALAGEVAFFSKMYAKVHNINIDDVDVPREENELTHGQILSR